ncbi:PEP-CTERM sorting domain-containing protein [Phycisphaera mikurensis]|uniref:Mannanase galactose-binding domain-containing protein n=1 Tax=Phycisphaera mikurensis (strain NBRC 102666 / KCTC 22515 / FYK2301M01) TaxID=1142394 RepID=I0IJ79_PHYMF|nr:PEP-CTERM sorting domain-containing protein [Phycisphaera mikurensis]MBB6443289.1 hypothetical protein [Phycisphaera mikurensis]BAM05317.1 hypothetical protein PSMK_31580 [Phycisphaera mikurensis NBRC 102666]
MTSRFPRLLAPVAAAALAAVPAAAAPFTPTQAQLGGLVTGFDGVVLTNTNEAGGTGVVLTADPTDNGGFSRVVAQLPSFDQDLSAFASFDLEIELAAGSTGIDSVSSFIQTGPAFTFEQSAAVSLSPGVAVPVSLDFSGTTGDLTAVRQIGLQFFGPGGAAAPGQVITIRPIPEPASLATLGVLGGAALLRRRRRGA